MLGAVPVPPGTYDVVTDTVTTGVIAHEAFGHGMETDMFLKERARAADYLGKRVGSDLVNIVDDPSMPGAYGSYFVDDEGREAGPTQIIRDGILQGGLTDLYSASRLGIRRTANGRRESVHRKAYARMSNTFFTPGSSTREELLESLDDGVLLRQTLNGMEDPKGWGIQIWALFARRVQARQAHGADLLPGRDHRLRARRAGRCVHGLRRLRARRRHLRQGLEGAGACHLGRSSSPYALPAGLNMDRRLTDALERHPAVARLDRSPAGRPRRPDLPGGQPGGERPPDRARVVRGGAVQRPRGRWRTQPRGGQGAGLARRPRAAAGGAGDSDHHGQPGQQPTLVPAGAARHARGGAGRRLADLGRGRAGRGS